MLPSPPPAAAAAAAAPWTPPLQSGLPEQPSLTPCRPRGGRKAAVDAAPCGLGGSAQLAVGSVEAPSTEAAGEGGAAPSAPPLTRLRAHGKVGKSGVAHAPTQPAPACLQAASRIRISPRARRITAQHSHAHPP